MTAPVDRLRRLAEALPALGDDGGWLSARLAAYLAAGGRMTLDDALDLSVRAGGAPWWRSEALARRNAAIRELAAVVGGVEAVASAISRYETTRWRQDQALDVMPLGYAGTARALLFIAFREGGGRVPTSAKRLGLIIRGHESPPFHVRDLGALSDSTDEETNERSCQNS